MKPRQDQSSSSSPPSGRDLFDRLHLDVQAEGWTPIAVADLHDPLLSSRDLGVLLWLLRGSRTRVASKWAVRNDAGLNAAQLKESLAALQARYPGLIEVQADGQLQIEPTAMPPAKQFVRVPNELVFHRRKLKLSWDGLRALIILGNLWGHPELADGGLPRYRGRQLAEVLGGTEGQGRRILNSLPALPSLVNDLEALFCTGMPAAPAPLEEVPLSAELRDFFGTLGTASQADTQTTTSSPAPAQSPPAPTSDSGLDDLLAGIAQHFLDTNAEAFKAKPLVQERVLSISRMQVEKKHLTAGQTRQLLRDAWEARGMRWSKASTIEDLAAGLAKVGPEARAKPPTKYRFPPTQIPGIAKQEFEIDILELDHEVAMTIARECATLEEVRDWIRTKVLPMVAGQGSPGLQPKATPLPT